MAGRISDYVYLVLQIPSATTRTSIVPIPFAGMLIQAHVAVDSAPTTASLALTKTNGHALITAKDLSALTANTGADCVLSTLAPSKTLHLDKGDCVIAVNTISSAASLTCTTVVLVIQPDAS
jgi:hypothetical protein